MECEFKPGQIVLLNDPLYYDKLVKFKEYRADMFCLVELIPEKTPYLCVMGDLTKQHGVCVEQLTTRQGKE
jgi:hypothetical protein